MTEPQNSAEEPNLADEKQATRLQDALAMEHLVAANAESQQTMVQLVNSVRAETKARDRKVEALERSQQQMKRLNTLAMAALICLLLLAVFNAFTIAETRRNAERSTAIASKVNQTNTFLLDCLNSTGRCGQVNAQQQRLILDEVKKYELTGFYCIRNNPANTDPDAEQFLSCMNRLYPSGPKLNAKLN